MNEEAEDAAEYALEDEEFDRLFPARLRRLSAVHWTSVPVATVAARLLVTEPGVRVLDIGSGPGKFCLVGATVTRGHFTGVEQRKELVLAARQAATDLGLLRVEFLHRNIVTIPFADYDAFYLYNPFEENFSRTQRIDGAVPLSPDLFKSYSRYVAHELGQKPVATRVVSYAGYADEIPSCYECEATCLDDELKLWVKRREYQAELEHLAPSRSYRGPCGWAPPRRAR